MTTRTSVLSLLAPLLLLVPLTLGQSTAAPATTLPPAPAGYHWWLVPNTPPGTPAATPIPTAVNPPAPAPTYPPQAAPVVVTPPQPAYVPQPQPQPALGFDPAQINALIQSGIQTALQGGIIRQPETADRYLGYGALATAGLTLLTSLFGAFRGQQTHTLASRDTTNPAVAEAATAKAPPGYTVVPTSTRSAAVPRMPGT